MWRRVVLASVLFVLGFTTVFVALGAGACTFGQYPVAIKRRAWRSPPGVVIILFGLHFLGVLRIPLLYREARFQATTQARATPAPM